jgi:subtilisin family serine protease/Tol biopolymer transport system component
MQQCRRFTRPLVLVTTMLLAAPVFAFQDAARIGGWPAAPAAPAARLVRHYYKEARPLLLDVGRVGVHALAGFDPAHLLPVLDPTGIEPMAAPGWSLIRLRDPATVETIDALLEQLATVPDWDFVTPVFQDEYGPLLVTPQILMRFDPSVSRQTAEGVLESAVPGVASEADWAGMRGAWRVETSERNGLRLLDAANTLARRTDVLFAEPDFLCTAQLLGDPPNDPMFAFSWGLYNSGNFFFDSDFDMGLEQAWAVTQGDPDVRVFVLDSGIDLAHPDLNVASGGDFTGQGSPGGAPFNACDSHGTWVAGCISAKVDNGLGSAGVAPLCKSVPGRVIITSLVTCDNHGVIQSSWVVNALNWAFNHQLRITNTSLGLGETSAVAAKYLDTHNQGMVHFSAAGNDGLGVVTFPARAPGVIGIGATSFDGHRAAWSNYGQALDLVAPGFLIRTTDRVGPLGSTLGDYEIVSGTSVASPLAAGIAALLLSAQPGLTPTEVEQHLVDSARELETPGWDPLSGWGMPRADRALAAALGRPATAEDLRTCNGLSFSDGGHSMAFASDSPDLVAGDTNGKRDVFLRNIPVGIATTSGNPGTGSLGSPGAIGGLGSGAHGAGALGGGLVGTIERVSVSSSGEQANDESRGPSMTPDGRYILFESWASNLVPGDGNACRDIFLRDLQLGTTVRVSVSTLGAEANGESTVASMSTDGRFIAFGSAATNLDPAATNGLLQVYLRDMWIGTTTLLSKTQAGVAGDHFSLAPSISGDGQRVAFASLTSNLAASDAWPNVVLVEVATGALSSLNVDTAGQSPAGMAIRALLSRDGNRVAFTSDSALVPSDTNGLLDVYVRDLAAGTTTPVSVDGAGVFGDRESHAEALSADGRFIVFTSAATNFDPADTNGYVDVFRKDLLTGAVVRVSVGNSLKQAMAGCGHPWISPDGGRVGFTCRDDALVPGDALDGAADVYRRNVLAGTTELLTPGS